MTEARKWNWPVINRQMWKLYLRGFYGETVAYADNMLMTKPDFAAALSGFVFLGIAIGASGAWRPSPPSGSLVVIAQSRQDHQPEVTRQSIEDVYRYVDSHDRAVADHAKAMDAVVIDNIKQTNAVREDVAALKSKIDWILMIAASILIAKLPALFGPFVRSKRRDTILPGGEVV